MSQANSTNSVCVGIFYRSPSSLYACMDDFYTFLENMDVSLLSKLIFVGDFNINFYDTHQSLYHKLDNIISTFSLTQIVKDPTHINHSGADTLLDLVLVSSQSQVESYHLFATQITKGYYSNGNGEKPQNVCDQSREPSGNSRWQTLKWHVTYSLRWTGMT